MRKKQIYDNDTSEDDARAGRLAVRRVRSAKKETKNDNKDEKHGEATTPTLNLKNIFYKKRVSSSEQDFVSYH